MNGFQHFDSPHVKKISGFPYIWFLYLSVFGRKASHGNNWWLTRRYAWNSYIHLLNWEGFGVYHYWPHCEEAPENHDLILYIGMSLHIINLVFWVTQLFLYIGVFVHCPWSSLYWVIFISFSLTIFWELSLNLYLFYLALYNN